ncbi:MAG: hypothetical protein HDR43_02495 [Mycoplasma sp.]|nr:hypothetical protein [Mycoplasma sp.]
MFRKNKLENIKLGNNDNYDNGNNKNNKTKISRKNLFKNFEINNIKYDPNKIIVELIKEISTKERQIAAKIQELQKCKDCLINNKKLTDDINKEQDKISNEYSLEKQIRSMSPILYDTTNIMNKLHLLIVKIHNFECNNSCDSHIDYLNEINLDRAELKSLKESLETLKVNQ